MALNFISADERLKKRDKVNIAIFGPSGVGKTTLARTLDPATTLFINLEAGDLALGDWPGTMVNVREEAAKAGVHPWEFCRALACLLSGPDPAASHRQESPSFHYSAAMFAAYEGALAPRAAFSHYKTIFVDSITVAGRYSFAWAQAQPAALSEKTGKYDGRGAYGLHGQEMVTWLTQLQHCPDKSIVVVGILDSDVDDFKRVIYSPQIDGGKTGKELPGIFDQVLTLGLFTFDAAGNPVFDLTKGTQRAFVCHQNNGYGLPAKDRTGTLDLFEPPNLAQMMAKIALGKRIDNTLVTTMPAAPAQPAAAA